MERNSGVSFHQAQVALARLWIGDGTSNEKPIEKVAIKKPSPTGEGMLVSDETKTEIEEIPLPKSEEEAREIIEKFESGARGLRGDEEVADTVSQHLLEDRTGLAEETWLGTEEEELDCFVTELLYIHSKVMIVDDKRVIVSPYYFSSLAVTVILIHGVPAFFRQMCSANINDRSQKVQSFVSQSLFSWSLTLRGFLRI